MADARGGPKPSFLLREDRSEYERLLDEALRSAPHRPELAAVGQRLNPEQLRTMALNATGLITAAAVTEYRHYVFVRDESRRSESSDGVEEGDGAASALAATVGEDTGTAGAGALAVAAVLAPVLAGGVTAIFLLVGYILRMLDPEPAFAQTMLTTGWVFGAVTAAAIFVAAVGLLLTALRNSPDAEEAGAYGELTGEVAQAREVWREALLERGILPFLREALAHSDSSAASRKPTPEPTTGRMPHLGYNRPGFSSSDDNASTGHRPSYSSPDFSSPDFGGPHAPELDGPDTQPD
ncbi:hypothetical protein ACH4TV_08910 [Streptomyces sp. NPDC020898]|uniref:hypothetical protein n=1 Tax=Streptomyces sp. NPDC020898 TaxID=3365101 RepID=UPI0037B15479